MKRSCIRIRDPFILFENGIYYMYATSGERTLSYYRSVDLEHWEMGGIAFEIPENFWAYKDVWAAEVHPYKGKYYLFVSLLGKNGLRGTQIAVSDKPDGRFIPLVDRPVTPLDQSCIDGTLFVDGDTPYIVYSRDWPDHYVSEKGAYVGQISAQQLSEDLTTPVGEPFCLFESSDCPYSAERPAKHGWEGKDVVRYGSDAPFINRLSDGRLFLTWSPFAANNYVVLGAVAEDIHGPWTHLEKPLYDNNGGHAMFFTAFDGTRKMCIHQPEKYPEERTRLLNVVERDGQLAIES